MKLNTVLTTLCLGTLFTTSAVADKFALNARGQVAMPEAPGRPLVDRLVAETVLSGCTLVGEVQIKEREGGGKECRKELRRPSDGRECLLIERLTPTEQGMRWEIEIRGTGEPWSAPIQTVMQWRQADDLTWWTAWGDRRPEAPMGRRSGSPNRSEWWSDPLVPMPFAAAKFFYGGRTFDQPQGFCLPIVSVLDDAADAGVSLVMSPEDLTLNMDLGVTPGGKVTVSRSNHRISAKRPVSFSMDLVRHPADWRAGLGWMAQRYPAFVDPPNPRVREMAGCGAYSSHARNLDADRLRRMAFMVNWKASFDFPYMGMFVPPVPDDTTEWTDMKSMPTSINRMREDIRCYTDHGFHVLSYFNVTEFGCHIKHPAPPRKAERDEDLWRDANDYLYHVLKDAILNRPGQDKPIFSWKNCIAMDPGDPAFRKFLLKQAELHIEKFPESSGICIDRMDWLTRYNRRFDDGVSWIDGKPARSLVTSWHGIIGEIGAIMHDNDKVIYCNPHYRRMDLMRHLDGVYDEFGQMGHSMNLCALLGLRKPVMAWTIMTPEFEQAPDDYFQRHLHMGACLTAPVPGNDHTILPTENVDRIYFDYGPMLKALAGKEWVLAAHAVKVVDGNAKANLFKVNDGYVVPVTFGGDSRQARIQLRHLEKRPSMEALRAEVLHPGKMDWTPLKLAEDSGTVTIKVALVRGCAMVRIY